eukprot:CAMPEP_0179072972 /NCGR_PEP_ID=MMETSP0796-20121207/32330_1 /TAXON_ID=73915 /ORGANISM="Pyrodinium bahamense, Strain pbaha01" /LENGTH=139 /DNA_ID=CAMNT_0020770149 /DNA_START=69 /DNA_END=488 /DNA_ORIENTATION=+
MPVAVPAGKAEMYGGQPVVMGQQVMGGSQPPVILGPNQQAPVSKKPRTWWDPCPVPWEETPARRCGRYALAAVILLGLAAVAAYLLYSLAQGETVCSELNDSREECQANPECRWFGEDGARAWHGGEAYSHNGQNCAQK